MSGSEIIAAIVGGIIMVALTIVLTIVRELTRSRRNGKSKPRDPSQDEAGGMTVGFWREEFREVVDESLKPVREQLDRIERTVQPAAPPGGNVK